MAEEIHDDPSYTTLSELNDALEARVDIRPLAIAMVDAFASGQGDPEQFDGMVGLGREASALYKALEGESSRVRMMVEMMRLVNNCSHEEEDDLPEDMEDLAQSAAPLVSKHLPKEQQASG